MTPRDFMNGPLDHLRVVELIRMLKHHTCRTVWCKVNVVGFVEVPKAKVIRAWEDTLRRNVCAFEEKVGGDVTVHVMVHRKGHDWKPLKHEAYVVSIGEAGVSKGDHYFPYDF